VVCFSTGSEWRAAPKRLNGSKEEILNFIWMPAEALGKMRSSGKVCLSLLLAPLMLFLNTI
jgi:hypothetical protein